MARVARVLANTVSTALARTAVHLAVNCNLQNLASIAGATAGSVPA